MLILTRKHRESVVIQGVGDWGRPLKVTVLQVRGSRVSLGFDGPGEVTVHRLELWERTRPNDVNEVDSSRQVEAT